ncbi:hypothetical protein BUALT_Bualt14G0049100 [Buddleja alternifolia]|uniref:TF-B3 domain-containing protein n=1 Tax=Buddleja alternifolia TaxID=168488 RepID=A0AAV6WGP7_9LAMI|nr:hypothetical protein BUALT_Bualt14G0049100 [Buddleja alternifolia]
MEQAEKDEPVVESSCGEGDKDDADAVIITSESWMCQWRSVLDFLGFSSQNLMNIPPGFVEDIQEAWPENVTLRDQYENLWQVKVEKKGKIWYFTNGWTKFVADNLKSGDVVTFKYLGGGLFYVKIFGPDACEKERDPTSCEKEGTLNACENNGAESSKNKNTEDADKVAEEEEESGGEYDTDDEDFVVLSEEENEEGDDQGEQVLEEKEQDDDIGEQVVDAGPAAKRTRHRRKRISDWFDGELFRSGLARQPRNPYFVTRSKQCRKDELFIPKIVVQLHKLELPRFMKLVDGSGREFFTKRKVWTDGRTFYTGGWKNFCTLNMVNLEDKCICEFIRRKGRELRLRISVVRGNGQ